MLAFIHWVIVLTASSHQHADTDAPAQSQADVFLRSLPELGRAESLFPGCQVQQKQHCAARQVVQQFSVSSKLVVEISEPNHHTDNEHIGPS